MKTVYLHGKLGNKFGRKWRLNIKSLPEAFHAIDCNSPGFLDELIKDTNGGTRYLFLKKDASLIKSKEELEENVICLKRGDENISCEELHVISSIEGGSGFFVAWAVEFFTVKTLLNIVIMTAITYGIAALTKPPDPPKITSKQINTKSYLLNGPQNRASQGSPVPIGYGRLRVGSSVICSKREFIYRKGSGDDSAIESSSFIEYLDLLCEGPIVGFVDESGNVISDSEDYDKALYLNDTPVKNNHGLYNYILTENKNETHKDVIKIADGSEDSFDAKNIFDGVSYSRDYSTLLYGPRPYVKINGQENTRRYIDEKIKLLGLSANETITTAPESGNISKKNRAVNPIDEISLATDSGAKIFSHIVTNTNVNRLSIHFKIEMHRNNRKGDNFWNWCDFAILVQSGGRDYNVLDKDSGCLVTFNGSNAIQTGSTDIFLKQIIMDGSSQTSYKSDWLRDKGVNVVDKTEDQLDAILREDPVMLEQYHHYLLSRSYLRVRGIATSPFEFSVNIKFEWNDITEKLNSGMTFKIIKLSNEYDPATTTPDSEVFTTPGDEGENANKMGAILGDEFLETVDGGTIGSQLGPFDRINSVYNSVDGILNKRILYVSSIEEQIDKNFLYPNSALAYVKFDSRNFNSVPERSYHLKLKKVLVPSNYNPSSRKYDGPWDGLFNGQDEGESILSVADSDKKWTDNPAWIFYDLLSNPRFGIAKYGLEEFSIDKWQLYKVAKYCDQLVETGYPVETKILTPRPFNTNNLVDINSNKMTIKIENYFWSINSDGEPVYSVAGFSEADFKKEFGDGLSHQGKKIVFFINKHKSTSNTDAVRQKIQQKSCLRSGYYDIEERVIISSNMRKREVYVAGPALNLETSSLGGDTVGGCSTQINYPIVEPRFTANLYITDKMEGLAALNSLSSIFRGMIAYHGGKVSVTMDFPKNPIKLFTNSNVSPEGFSYSGQEKSKKFTSSIIRFNNREKIFRPDIVFEEDASAIQKFGFIQNETIGFGITSKSQAQRLARWNLMTSNIEGENIKFKTSSEANYLVPGAIFEVSDEMRVGKMQSGRLLGLSYYRPYNNNKQGTFFDPHFVLDKNSLDMGNLSRVEITISCGKRSEDVDNIEIRSRTLNYVSSEEQDEEINNITSAQIIKFEGVLDYIPEEKPNGVILKRTIVCDLMLKMEVSFSLRQNEILLYNHGFNNGDRVRFTSDGILPSGLSPTKIHLQSYHVINKTKNSFQVSETKYGSAVLIFSEGLDIMGNSGGRHYVCPENISDYSYRTVSSFDQISPGSTFSLKNFIFSGIDQSAPQEMLSMESLIFIGVIRNPDLLSFGDYVYSSFFGTVLLHSSSYIFSPSFGWIYIEDSDIGWFTISGMEKVYIDLQEYELRGAFKEYTLNVDAYNNDEKISSQILTSKNSEGEIDKMFIYHNDVENINIYSLIEDPESISQDDSLSGINAIGENEKIALLDSSGNQIRQLDTQEELDAQLISEWNSRILVLTKAEYDSLPDGTTKEFDELNNVYIFSLGKDVFKLNYFYIGPEQGLRVKVLSFQENGFWVHFPSLEPSLSFKPVPGSYVPSINFNKDTNPGLTQTSILNFSAIDSLNAVSGVDSIHVELVPGHGLSIEDNLSILIEGVSQNQESLEFQKNINQEWSTIYVSNNRIELINSIALKSILESEINTFNTLGGIRHVSTLKLEGKLNLERKLYRVVRMKELEQGEFEIIGSEYNINKFNAIDKNTTISRPYIPIPPQADMELPDAPSGLELFDYTIR